MLSFWLVDPWGGRRPQRLDASRVGIRIATATARLQDLELVLSSSCIRFGPQTNTSRKHQRDVGACVLSILVASDVPLGWGLRNDSDPGSLRRELMLLLIAASRRAKANLSCVAKLEIVLSPESSRTVSLAEDRDMVGASFTAVTVRVKVRVTESAPPASSLSTNVTVAEPLALAAGV